MKEFWGNKKSWTETILFLLVLLNYYLLNCVYQFTTYYYEILIVFFAIIFSKVMTEILAGENK